MSHNHRSHNKPFGFTRAVSTTPPEPVHDGSSVESGVAKRAYAIYLESGSADGHDVDHWLQAESELLHRHGLPAPSPTT